MLEVLPSYGSYGLFKRVEKEYGYFKDSDIFVMDFFLTCGDIKNINYVEKRDNLDNVVNVKEKLSTLNSYLNPNTDVRIWTSKIDVEDYLVFLYTLSLINNKVKSISVIFVDELTNSIPWSISCTSAEEVPKLLELERTLSISEIEDYLDEWELLVSDNSQIRLIFNNQVVSTNLEYLDDSIFDVLEENDEIKVNTLVGLLMSQYGSKYGYIEDTLYFKRIKDLIELGDISVVKYVDYKYWDGSTNKLYSSIVKLNLSKNY